jgi:hypothetical protein
MITKIYPGSINYTCTVVKLPHKQVIQGLDNLVNVCIFGNNCLISKDSDENKLWLFFPSGTILSEKFLAANNLYRHSELNADKTKKGFFEDNGRVKSVKFKGVVSTGFCIPVSALGEMGLVYTDLNVGDEFNEIDNEFICKKFINRHLESSKSPKIKTGRVLDEVVNSRLVPEHDDSSHLMRNTRKMDRNPIVAVTHKMHGTSLRVFKAPVKRPLRWYERLYAYFGGKIQDEVYDYVVGSRRVIKSIGFKTLSGKEHFYSEDLWSKAAKEYFDGKLFDGEAVFCEIVGKDYTKKAIQPGYTYGFETPKIFIYRIANINHQGVEVDLPYAQMKIRADQLGIPVCQELFYGRFNDFLEQFKAEGNTLDEKIEDVFYKKLLDKPDPVDPTVVNEGYVVRIDDIYPKPEMLKAKSPLFIKGESDLADKGNLDIEDQQSEE